VTLDRRAFLKTLGGVALGAATAGPLFARVPGGFARRPAAAPRTLVVLQLSGGNDGLNTLVPYSDDAYRRARPTLRIGADRVLKLDDRFGLHPNLKAFRALFDQGSLAIVRGVGYPNPARSHFESFDVWHAADARGRAAPAGAGWIGRYADAYGEEGAATTVHIGEIAPYSLVARRRAPVVMTGPESLRSPLGADMAGALPTDSSNKDDGARRSRRDDVRRALADARRAAERLRVAVERGRTKVEYPKTPLGAALKTAAAMIVGDAGVRVISTELPGFDTHVRQEARHDGLLKTLDDAVAAFRKDLSNEGRSGDVATLVFSEFGRRTAENGSFGTDHGAASVAFVFGDAVLGGYVGDAPSLADLERGDLRHTVDFRSIYATLLDKWCGADADSLLGATFPRAAFL
jgi:uncharacterized protein (DUF1501 family)